MPIQSHAILLSNEHSCINLLCLVFYSILLHVSALHISHHQEENWFTKRVERVETNSGCEVVK
jgi:hypothetical protein